MNDRDFSPAQRALHDMAGRSSHGIQKDIIAALSVVGGFAAISLLMDMLLGQLFG